MDKQTNGHMGCVKDGTDVFTFQMGTNATTGEIDMEQFAGIPLPMVLNVGGYKVLIKGKNNTLPDETEAVIGGNRLLPELLNKRAQLLYGEGLQADQKCGVSRLKDINFPQEISPWDSRALNNSRGWTMVFRKEGIELV
ncbi:MAG: hypothetical protein JEZ14_11625 [Marinilabiliaceae bacterium]|nr:hypothetical protein [Marinilabiliaceae bacterium]